MYTYNDDDDIYRKNKNKYFVYYKDIGKLTKFCFFKMEIFLFIIIKVLIWLFPSLYHGKLQ